MYVTVNRVSMVDRPITKQQPTMAVMKPMDATSVIVVPSVWLELLTTWSDSFTRRKIRKEPVDSLKRTRDYERKDPDRCQIIYTIFLLFNVFMMNSPLFPLFSCKPIKLFAKMPCYYLLRGRNNGRQHYQLSVAVEEHKILGTLDVRTCTVKPSKTRPQYELVTRKENKKRNVTGRSADQVKLMAKTK